MPLFYFLQRIKIRTPALASKFVTAALLAFPFSGALHFSFSHHPLISFYPVQELYHINKYLNEVHVLVKEYRATDHFFTGDLRPSEGVTSILLLGEAARRDKFGVHGSDKGATPNLDRFKQENASNILLFDEAIASAAYTRISIPSVLSVLPSKQFSEISRNPGILKIMKAAEQEVVLISNQAKKGFHDSFITAFMEDASSKTYLTDEGHHYDEDLVPLLLQELEKPGEDNRLIIVHLAGSHHPYDAKYPESEAYFSPDTIENKYLNSIRYTDSVMQSIFEAVMKVEYPVAMLYTSDHGEYVNDFGDGVSRSWE